MALWREGLLAQKVLRGATKGYRNHPQLQRFKAHADPLAAIASYLDVVQKEATRRGYRFDASKIVPHGKAAKIRVHDGQLAYEQAHLEAKLKVRDPAACERLRAHATLAVHPLFRVVSGGVEDWEIR